MLASELFWRPVLAYTLSATQYIWVLELPCSELEQTEGIKMSAFSTLLSDLIQLTSCVPGMCFL